ncbi:D-3-phosphoglycerate dehydrogenase [Philodulcilactobacillus myokoensis]|uniref:D-3-phosphoglycerate dehydrogenase n=1 Tax=Philodulcilactobacillus myokoensis TaxID=2929573 RepID=A0A9W6ET54_9LACO|nr:phosphoglycerate dehydrogenase [Philodulcilactobacillus myokoensis]GLB47450.1 D-3-phosphoglycerate dehydrogenase [Philodulcilactobacillus myokoensis]
MYQVKTYNVIAQEGLDTFTKDYQINKSDHADAFLIRSADMHHVNFPDRLKVIARSGAGFNNIPLERATKQGIAVFNTAGSNANAVRELVIAVMVATSRNLIPAYHYAEQNSGADISLHTEKAKDNFRGSELAGKKLAVIGVGHVGSLVANAASALGMDVYGYDPYLNTDAAWRISTSIHRVDSMKEAIQNADYVTVHVPKNKQTTGLISAKEMEMMKPGVHLFNYSRIGIVNNTDVVKYLDNHKIKTYATDFGEDQILGRDDVIVTPHIGGATHEAERNGSTQAARTIMKYLKTGDTTNSVNLPQLRLPFEGPLRITLIHQNVPKMVGKLTDILGDAGVNIDKMSNASLEHTAYTIIDVDGLKDEQKVLNQLKQIDGVYGVRLLKK